MLTETEAQQIAKKFLADKYPRSQIAFSSHQLIIRDDIQIYRLEGKITMGSRGALTHLVLPTSANRYDLKIEIQAQQGKVINYEFS